MRKLFYSASGVALLLATFFGLWKISNSRSFQFFGEIVPRVETSQKVLALTFDDGPTRARTVSAWPVPWSEIYAVTQPLFENLCTPNARLIGSFRTTHTNYFPICGDGIGCRRAGGLIAEDIVGFLAAKTR